MISDRQSLQRALATVPLALECEDLGDGAFRVATPLLYPDGSRVEVFYRPNIDLFAASRLTDRGQTAARLADSQVFIDGYEKRQHILADICRTLRIGNVDGELRVTVEADGSLPDAVMRLAQACVRVADLHYTQSFRAQSDFRNVLAAFFNRARPDHIEDYTIEGQYGRRVKVDFFTRQNGGVDNLVIALFSVNETSAHSVANDVFCRWYDLDKRYHGDYQFLTVVDSNSRAFRPADLQRVGSLSRVLGFPADEEELRAAVSPEGKL